MDRHREAPLTLFLVVCNQSFHRTLSNVPDGIAFCTGCCLQLVGIVLCHAAYETDGQVATAIRFDVTLEKVAEIIDHQLLQQWAVQMFANKQ